MKNGFSIVLLLMLSLLSCLDESSMYEQISVLKTPLQRIDDLNSSTIDIKKSEEKAALVRQENDFLEYEYPINEDESYVISYRFDDVGCFEIGLDTYFNKKEEAQNVVNGIVNEMKSKYGEPGIEPDFYRWETDSVSIVLDVQNVERGMISLTFFSLE